MACLAAARGLTGPSLAHHHTSTTERLDLSSSSGGAFNGGSSRTWWCPTPSSSSSSSSSSLLTVQASKRKLWRAEPAVSQKVSNRARLAIRELRGLTIINTNTGGSGGGDHDQQKEDDEHPPADEQQQHPQQQHPQQPPPFSTAVWECLRRWVRGMNPKRRDWLDLLIEFDNDRDRELYFAVTHFALSESSFEACARDHTKLIDKYGKLRRADDAHRAVAAMRAQGVPPTAVTYTVLISLYGRLGQPERARATYDEMVQVGGAAAPDARAATAMAVAYGLAGQPENAEQLLLSSAPSSSSAAPSPSAHLLTTESMTALIAAYARAGDAAAAERVFNLMQPHGVTPGLKSFTALIDAYTRAGKLELSDGPDPNPNHPNNQQHLQAAVRTFQALLDVGLAPDDRLVARMVTAYQAAGALHLAVKLLGDLERAGARPGPDALAGLAGYLARAGKVADAEDVFNEYRRRGFPLTRRLAAAMYDAHARAGQLDKARDVVRAMREAGVELDGVVCTRFVRGLVAGKLPGWCTRVW